MMSLFSSFDLFFFYKNIWSLYFLLSSLFLKFYFTSSSYLMLNNLISNLSLFFFSLKSKSFNKSSSMIFMGIFFFFVCMNFFSVFSFNFPFTSQASVVISMSLSFWFMMIIFSLVQSTYKFFYHLIPEGTPLPLTFLLFLIEMVSNLIRPLTLSVRLVANILAGHLLMLLLSQLVFFFNFSYPFYIVLNSVEIFVSLIQSYIFATMLVLYFSEV